MLDLKIVGQVLKEYRESKCMTQEILSGLADIDRSHLSKIELGLRSPTITILYKIADTIGIKTSEILRTIEKEIDKQGKQR